MKRKGINIMLLAAAAMTLGVLVYRTRQRPVVQISREAWEYYHTSLYSGYPSTPNRKDWNSRLLEDDLRYARQAGDLEWLDQLKRVQAAARCQTPQYNWYPACNIQLTDEPRLQGPIPLLTREEALTPDVQAALEEILFRFASLRCHPNSEGLLTIEKAYFIDSELGNTAQLLAWVREDQGGPEEPKTFVLVIYNLHQAKNRWVYWNDQFGYSTDFCELGLPPDEDWPEYHATPLPRIEGASMRIEEMEWMLGRL